jgi:hypothetical protein
MAAPAAINLPPILSFMFHTPFVIAKRQSFAAK